jgi:hypothetical protein
LVAAVERGFDRVGVFDVHAQHIGDEAADEGESLLALAEDGFDAFADAFAAGFEILQQLLSRDQAGAVLLGGAEVFADLLDLLAKLLGVATLGFELLLLIVDRGEDDLQLVVGLRALRVEGFNLAQNNLPAFGEALLL